MAKAMLLVLLVLVLPIVLLVARGESFLQQIQHWTKAPPATETLFACVVGILAADLFLPVPSGPVSTLAGSQLGLGLGTAASALGMTLGGLVGFALAWRWGKPAAQKYCSRRQLEQLTTLCSRHGGWILLATRPLPIIAEAAVLALGALGMGWRDFVPLLVVSNLVLAAGFAYLGATASSQGWLPLALCLSVAVPLVGTALWGRLSKPSSSQGVSD